MESIWRASCELKKRPRLQEDAETEVLVIGGGMAGILTAWQLQRAGKKVILLEAGRIAGGQTQNTTAKLTSQHGLCYERLLREAGEKRASAYVRLQQEAISEYERVIRERQIECDFEPQSAFVFSQDTQSLKQEARAARRLGVEAEFVKTVPLPFAAGGAVKVEGQAQFHPLKFIKGLIDELDIYEQTPVLSVEGGTARTERAKIRAEAIVFACHYPFINFPGMYFSRIHQERSYVLALENAGQDQGMYIGAGAMPYSFRGYGNLLLLGGGGHVCGENTKGGRYELLREKARQWFPQSREVRRWSAQDCITADHLPFIGLYAAAKPNWYVLSGFQKWGMSSSMAAALLLTERICGREPSVSGVVSPRRFSMREMKQTVKMGAKAVSCIGKRLFEAPKHTARDLRPGHGAIVRTDSGKAGLYRDEKGRLHAVSVRCPHLGCQLAWNGDEKSWDCPCHGSRFDYDGNLLSGPAQTSISRKKEGATGFSADTTDER